MHKDEEVKGKSQCSLSRDSFLLDSDSSDSDGESPIKDISEEQDKRMMKDEDSSLEQILDSLYYGEYEKGSDLQPNKADGLGVVRGIKTNLNSTALPR
ncbi:hypothetical protein Sjap_018564 [Stephania japonica]|uniref:Uncharacterized protein n=1 Tax=Stephania japonica TaxID=461633 RepID=A0AAP0I890_9MAGN